MRAFIAAVILTVSLGSSLVSASHCDSDPECNGGRGSVAGFICLRSEINPVTNEFNGRVCTWSQGQGTIYIYARWIYNREPVTLCRNGLQVFPQVTPANTSTCRIVSH